MDVGSSGVGSRVQPSTRNAEDVVQHLVNASFDVVFEESGEAGMFSSDDLDHPFEQQAESRVKLDESNTSLNGKHVGGGGCTVLGCTTTAKVRGLCHKHGGQYQERVRASRLHHKRTSTWSLLQASE